MQKLQEQVTGYEQEIEQFDLIKSDWEMEKDALQEVLLKLRLQLKEKEDQLNAVQSSMVCPFLMPRKFIKNFDILPFLSHEQARYFIQKKTNKSYTTIFFQAAVNNDVRILVCFTLVIST